MYSSARQLLFNPHKYLFLTLVFILSEGVSTTLVHATSVYDGFNPDPNDIIYSMVVQADNKILICGDFTDQASTSGARPPIARYNADGSLDLKEAIVISGRWAKRMVDTTIHQHHRFSQ